MFRSTFRMILAALLGLPLLSLAQDRTVVDFAAYAGTQNKVFIQLYEKRDTTSYCNLLQGWLQLYASLADTARKKYQSYLANAYYNLACTYALLDRTDPAFDYLAKAIQAGYTNYAHIMKDGDLVSVRRQPRFSQLVAPLRATGDYLYILNRGKTYDPADKRPLPAFTYQPATDTPLVALRAAFRLDSIAGKGNDVSKVLNLLHWVHELIPHDGNHENPAVRNALQLISVCQKEGRGLNCRGLATVLNECYLALGFPSRLVTCLPKDSLRTDPDCHVINMVWVPSLQKWIWADPTQDAWVMNEKGELLGIEEVRQRLINKEPLILNPTANWNHQVSATKEEYLYSYMAKNLYMLQCPVSSAYNMEDPAQGKVIEYIQLLPLDYFKQSPAIKESTSQRTGTTYRYFNTNNPASFWQKP